MKPSRAASEYLAAIGRKGGKVKGPQKRRSKAHYAAMGKASAAARAAKRKDVP